MRRWQEIALLLVADTIASIMALVIALWFRQAAALEAIVFPVSAYIIPGMLLGVAWICLFAYIGLYEEGWSRSSRLDELIWIFKAVFLGGVIIYALTFDPERPFALTRIVIFSYGLSLVAVSAMGRLVVRYIQRRLFELGHGRRNTLIVGTGSAARRLRESIERHPRMGYRIVGIVEVNGTVDETTDPDEVISCIGHVDDLPALVVRHVASEVMFGDPDLSHERVLDAVARCYGLRVDFSVLPDLYDVVTGRSNLGQIFGINLMPLFPSHLAVWQRRTKRVIDVVVSVIALVLGFPVWLVVSLTIWLQDRGDVFYSQERVGLDERLVNVHKFRSMVTNAESVSGPVWAQENDPRVTPIGRFLRKTRLDEVPQLWNVLRGEMSLVGPRPERPYFVEKLAKEIPLYRRRHQIKPGITGWAQTRATYASSIDETKEKLKYDLYYVENISLRFDMLILARTVWVVLVGKGAR
jgi:exopolysaccharide biosynthesis polyprenyl glycosylphosphotransferase